MNYMEIRKDLFEYLYEGFALAHCISADFALGAGIAKKFETRFHIKEKLLTKFGPRWDFDTAGATCIACGPLTYDMFGIRKTMIFNLVTKDRYWEKPTLENMEKALIVLRKQCEKYNIRKLAMPRIGCGLDKLDWEDVSLLIRNVFSDCNITIIVCYL